MSTKSVAWALLCVATLITGCAQPAEPVKTIHDLPGHYYEIVKDYPAAEQRKFLETPPKDWDAFIANRVAASPIPTSTHTPTLTTTSTSTRSSAVIPTTSSVLQEVIQPEQASISEPEVYIVGPFEKFEDCTLIADGVPTPHSECYATDDGFYFDAQEN
ncbi:hypothetical protein QVA66_09840 [Staphylococcus chromogenes]|nr:hypothetical protein [Staphylococcus chromogenes]